MTKIRIKINAGSTYIQGTTGPCFIILEAAIDATPPLPYVLEADYRRIPLRLLDKELEKNSVVLMMRWLKKAG
jgi:hypothetical protein